MKYRGCIKSSEEVNFPEKRCESGQSGQAKPALAARADQTGCKIVVGAVRKARKDSEMRCPEKSLALRSSEGWALGASRKGSLGTWGQTEQ